MPFLYKKITKALLIYKIEKETSFFHKENLNLSLRLFFSIFKDYKGINP